MTSTVEAEFTSYIGGVSVSLSSRVSLDHRSMLYRYISVASMSLLSGIATGHLHSTRAPVSVQVAAEAGHNGKSRCTVEWRTLCKVYLVSHEGRLLSL